MIKFKVCPRCQGDLYLKEDIFGRYLSCLQCGYLRDVQAINPRADSNPDVRIEGRGLPISAVLR